MATAAASSAATAATVTPKSVRRLRAPSPRVLSAALTSGEPFVVEGATTLWPAASWTTTTLRSPPFADRLVKVRLHRRSSREDAAPADAPCRCCSARSEAAFALWASSDSRAACGHNAGVVWEGDCEFVTTTLGMFCEWLHSATADAGAGSGAGAGAGAGSGSGTGAARRANTLREYDRREWWGYVDYVHLKALFAERETGTDAAAPDADGLHAASSPLAEAARALPWNATFGAGAPADGMESTLWVGSDGACTPCHYDTYGCNLVAQLVGVKHWTLFAPSDSECLYPTRVPYEESSVFSLVDVSAAAESTATRARTHPKFAGATPLHVMLGAGDALFVPRHYWHFVECLTPSMSVNNWVPVPADDDERVREAVTAALFAQLAPGAAGAAPTVDAGSAPATKKTLLNPTQEALSADAAHDMLEVALRRAISTGARDGGGGGGGSNNGDADSTSGAMRTRRALLHAVLQPQCVKAITSALCDAVVLPGLRIDAGDGTNGAESGDGRGGRDGDHEGDYDAPAMITPAPKRPRTGD